jgi:hypothetical protein
MEIEIIGRLTGAVLENLVRDPFFPNVRPAVAIEIKEAAKQIVRHHQSSSS